MGKASILKVIVFIIAIYSFTVNEAFAQEAMQSIGMTISALTGTIQNQYGSSGFGVEQIDLTYFPRYNFIESDNSSVSIGAPVSMGIGLVAMSINGGGEVAFSYDFPVVLDYNIGFKSTMNNDHTFGIYFGAGFGYNQTAISRNNNLGYNGASYGPLLRAGVRIGSQKESWEGHGLTIGIFYKKGMEKEKMSTFGFNVLMDI